jgi:hypothetical protein
MSGHTFYAADKTAVKVVFYKFCSERKIYVSAFYVNGYSLYMKVAFFPIYPGW